MRKLYLILILVFISLSMCSCSRKEEFLQEYELTDGYVTWAGIKFGIDTQDEAYAKLKSLDLFDLSNVKEVEYFMYGGSGIIVEIFPGPLRFHVIEDPQGKIIVVGLIYSVSFKSEQVFELVSEPEKVFIGVGTHGLDGRRIVLINRTFGYILDGVAIVQDAESESYLLDKSQKYILYLFSPDYYDLYLEKALAEYIGEFPDEDDFLDWKGYIEYNVYTPWE